MLVQLIVCQLKLSKRYIKFNVVVIPMKCMSKLAVERPFK